MDRSVLGDVHLDTLSQADSGQRLGLDVVWAGATGLILEPMEIRRFIQMFATQHLCATCLTLTCSDAGHAVTRS